MPKWLRGVLLCLVLQRCVDLSFYLCCSLRSIRLLSLKSFLSTLLLCPVRSNHLVTLLIYSFHFSVFSFSRFHQGYILFCIFGFHFPHYPFLLGSKIWACGCSSLSLANWIMNITVPSTPYL